ncbi:DMT family transporter [Cereibacter sphaeroides]|uniref:DMT family transporter n=1 Tax=Cereibacter sphaeroides TaxID=1063 RepID=UPI001F373502|nr:DMT family transporter [Cereibacter sphaeroides]MCE6961183.1 DMT family transporter [Cereibacter sphaeroides]MCE6970169.1 DMT family transporter [Cereibacter sphaeroides]MCE6974092.1 DMT family transporter [Cereibacter sphaeroides]
MTDWIISLEGTEAGARLAILLALTSALAHACFGALQKGRHDPWLARGAMDAFMVLLSAPVALFVVPWPQGFEWLVMVGVIAIHLAYKIAMARAYSQAAYTVVYPVVRGVGPLATLVFAAAFLGEHYVPLQWFGVAVLSGAILMLARLNFGGAAVPARAALRAGLIWAFAGGLLVAVYTTYDAWAIRLMPDPFTFLAWFFLMTSLDFPLMLGYRLVKARQMPEAAGALAARGFIGALIAFVSFGGVMLGTRLGKVAEVASLRETSTLFAAAIGWLVLGERSGPAKILLMGLIALGAILVQAA